jgi:transcription elongation GreA/GreB family factor
MTFKQITHAHCLELLNEKIGRLKNILQELRNSAGNNTKSSAGDKHETERAMIQIEQENTGKQLQEAENQKMQLEKIDPAKTSAQITQGSLIKTERGYLFLAIPLGKINVQGETVQVISPQSPLGKKLSGLAVGGSFEINGVGYVVECIY